MARFGVGIKYDTYDADGNAVNKTDALGSRTYKYDGDRRLTEQDLPDGKTVKWTYDAGGRPTQAFDWNGTYNYVFDALNRITQETQPSGKSIKHTFDAMGNETARVDYFGNKYSYAFDALNRPVQVTDSLNGVTGMVYDRMQHVLQVHYQNKTSVNTTYDPTYDVLSVVNKKDTGAVISQFVYTYDAVGNKKTVIDNIGKTTYDYDDIYQLTSAAYPDRPTVSYTYDPAGNRSSMTVGSTNTTYSYDGANKLLAAGTVSYTYDGNGNPTRKTDSSNGQTTTYTYDTENRLTGATLPNGNSFIYGYDYTGMKISDTQKGPGGNPDTHQYLWSFGSVVNEDGNEGQTADNVVGAVNLSQILTPKTNYIPRVLYYSFDGLASVVNTTDAGGNITDSYRYDAYGATLSGGKTKDNHYQFAGKVGVENEASIGLSYMRNRWYDPSVGRFMTQDPIDIRGGINLYRYADNNVLRFIDFLGLQTATPSSDLSPTQGQYTTIEDSINNYFTENPQATNLVLAGAGVVLAVNPFFDSSVALYEAYTAGNLALNSTTLAAGYNSVSFMYSFDSYLNTLNNQPTFGDPYVPVIQSGIEFGSYLTGNGNIFSLAVNGTIAFYGVYQSGNGTTVLPLGTAENTNSNFEFMSGSARASPMVAILNNQMVLLNADGTVSVLNPISCPNTNH